MKHSLKFGAALWTVWLAVFLSANEFTNQLRSEPGSNTPIGENAYFELIQQYPSRKAFEEQLLGALKSPKRNERLIALCFIEKYCDYLDFTMEQKRVLGEIARADDSSECRRRAISCLTECADIEFLPFFLHLAEHSKDRTAIPGFGGILRILEKHPNVEREPILEAVFESWECERQTLSAVTLDVIMPEPIRKRQSLHTLFDLVSPEDTAIYEKILARKDVAEVLEHYDTYSFEQFLKSIQKENLTEKEFWAFAQNAHLVAEREVTDADSLEILANCLLKINPDDARGAYLLLYAMLSDIQNYSYQSRLLQRYFYVDAELFPKQYLPFFRSLLFCKIEGDTASQIYRWKCNIFSRMLSMNLTKDEILHCVQELEKEMDSSEQTEQKIELMVHILGSYLSEKDFEFFLGRADALCLSEPRFYGTLARTVLHVQKEYARNRMPFEKEKLFKICAQHPRLALLTDLEDIYSADEFACFILEFFQQYPKKSVAQNLFYSEKDDLMPGMPRRAGYDGVYCIPLARPKQLYDSLLKNESQFPEVLQIVEYAEFKSRLRILERYSLH